MNTFKGKILFDVTLENQRGNKVAHFIQKAITEQFRFESNDYL